MRNSAGFTLIELMVTVAIISILAAIAYPNYTEYVIRSKVAEASAGLADYRVKLEQYYQDNRNYGPSSGNCASPPPVTGATGQYFTFTCTVGATNQTYVATATNRANVGLGAAGAYVFTINETNSKQTTAFTGNSSLPLNCWITKKAQTTC